MSVFQRPEPETLRLIKNVFLQAGLSLSSLELERLAKLDGLLKRRNAKLDLTRIEAPLNMVVKHYLDPALAARLFEPDGPLLDLGSGAGFPGLPMAVLRPDWRLVLAEPRRRRLAFVEEAIDLLALDNVDIFPHKVGPGFNLDIGAVVVRDFGPAAAVLPLASAVLSPGGRLHLMKGAAAAADLAAAEDCPQRADFGPAQISAYDLGAGRPARRLVSLVRLSRPEASEPGRTPKRARLATTEVASEANPRYKSWLRLLDGRGVKREGRTLMSGRKIVGEMLAQEPGRVLGALVRRESELDGLELPDGLPIFLLRPEIFPRLDLFGVGPPLLLAEAPSLPVWDPAAPFEGVRLFVPFQDPANVGAVLRTAAALGAETVLLKEAANPFHPKALRVSGPAAYLAGLRRGPALAELSAAENFFALSPVGRDIRSFKPPPALNLALGLEGPGLDRLWPPERRLAVPMKPGVESLNAAAAAAVALALVLLRRPAEPAAPRRPSPKPSRRRGSPRLEPR